MPAERNTCTRNNETSNLDPRRRPLAPRHNNSPEAEPQRAPTPYPSHLQTLEEHFTAGIIEMPVPRRPILSFPPQQESDDSSLEFLDEGGFRYPFPPFLPNVTCRPFVIPGLPDSSSSDAVVLHQFPGPLEIPPALEAMTGSYHVVPAQVFPSSSPMNTSSSPNPDSPLTASTDSPSMPPLASDVSDNGSLDHAPNLRLLADASEYVTATKGYSSDPQEFLVYSDDIIQRPSNDIARSWRSIPFNTSTPIQDVDPLERVLPHFPGAYATMVTRPPMGVPIDGNPAFGLRCILTTPADILRVAEPVGNWNQSDKEWEEDTWEYLLTRDDNLLESLWASLQDIKDPGVTDEVDRFRAVDAKIDLLLAARQSNNMNSPLSLPLPAQCLADFASVPSAKPKVIFRVSVGIGYALRADSYILNIHSATPLPWNLGKYPAPSRSLDIYKSVVPSGNSNDESREGGNVTPKSMISHAVLGFAGQDALFDIGIDGFEVLNSLNEDF
ncbi:uncharacterized protein FIBRA_09565 [Fibroporia radiculosa]|uniref:Uncharacterized protein n=1 Tax=Fibroporia radiculosa TaxID=599839 RepID=J7RWB5_9APHY|nr:uncharacterized protein FIBRA_09565 [Fibroporia radiculosa]CCM07220.1 predicted protein [Fibroporia radiculosa]